MKKAIFILLVLASAIAACTGDETFTPKPKGYFRIKFPKKEYRVYDAGCPFTFEYPVYANLVSDNEKNAQPCWLNMQFTEFNGNLHLTYHGVLSEKDYNNMTEAARTLAMKHTIRANAIDQKLINFPDKKVYGVYYAIEGNTASSVQFFLTDSVNHYFRGALYFNERPQYDSIQPVVKFIKKDIDKMIETFRWKN
ncbi:gliding motility lipoprotein GldD [Pedobacter frigiditerrae]|uniref:Gliding motility lipoprotein GldD n=1 Tax=Pedobacter frigiditerrae TaxID=2530452 RepID=A0A4R0N3R4_9SPHI|nr:gliding motility lipoprotein GldD [Pedobacter frigiditerrae]TCC93997.1 gliding motility lipoprotein GldD [Pedobacter frigiditerrae]